MTFLKQKTFGQKFIGLMLIAAMLTPLQSFADYKTIYTDTKTTPLSSGVTYEQHIKLTNGGWIYANVMRVQLDNPNIDVKPIYPDSSLSKKERLTTLAAEEKNLIGAINADFFDPKTYSTLGQIIDNGELVTSGTCNSAMASLNISKSNEAFVSYWKNYDIKLTNPKMDLPIIFKNKPYLDYDRAIIFDQKWSKKSFGNTLKKPIIEMLIIDNRVVNIVENGPPMDIPENGYVVSAVGKRLTDIKNNFAIDDPVFLDYNADLKNLDFSIGGGAQLLANGAVVPKFSTNILGYHPRTAVGITKDKKQLILLTIDGRTNNFRGIAQSELAKLLLELGAHEAINLDGGGSTEMIVKNIGQTTPKIVNTPSDGGERRVHNGIGVLSKSESGALDQLFIQIESTNVLLQSPVNIQLSGLDANRNTVALDPAQIKWTVSNSGGAVTNNQLVPTKSGKLTVTASYADKTISKEINVYKEIIDLDIQPKVIQLKAGTSAKLEMVGYTPNGYTLPVSATNVIWTIPDNLITIAPDGTVTANAKSGKGVLIATIDGVKKHIPVIVGADMTQLDNFDQNLNGVPSNATFGTSAAIVTGSYSQIPGSKDGTSAGQLTYDFSGATNTRAVYLNYANGGLVLNNIPDKLGLEVMGTNGNNHWLRAKITDATGKAVTVDFARNINWNDWKYVEATIPKGLTAPLKINHIYLVEDDPVKLDSGSILVDNLYAVNEKKNDVVVPKDTDKLPKVETMKIKTTGGTRVAIYGEFSGAEALVNYENYTAIAGNFNKYKYTFFAGAADKTMSDLLASDIQATKYSETVVGETIIVTMNSKNNSFIASDPLQWEKFLARMNNFRYKNLVLVTNHTMSFSDKLEEKLFTDQLEKLNLKGVKTYVLSGGQSNGYDVRLKNSATVIDVQTLNKYSGFDLKTQAGVLTMNLYGDKVEFQVVPLSFIVKQPTVDKRVKAPSSVKFKNIRTASPSR